MNHTMLTNYELAELAWLEENSDTKIFPCWEDFASHNAPQKVPCVNHFGTHLQAVGGAELEVSGDVEANAIIIVAGGGANIYIGGNVGLGARVLAVGGGAKVVVIGTIHPTAQVLAIGGGSEVVEIGMIR